MDAQTVHRPYGEVQRLLDEIGGKMRYRPGGGPGGFWELELRGRFHKVAVRDRRVNELDRLYVAKVDRPKTWDDYEHPGTLVDDAFWRLMNLFREETGRSRLVH